MDRSVRTTTAAADTGASPPRTHPTRAMILDRFLEFVARSGRAPSLREVARAVPVGPSTVMHHFGGIDGLADEAERAVRVWITSALVDGSPSSLLEPLQADGIGPWVTDGARPRRPWPPVVFAALGIEALDGRAQLFDDVLAVLGHFWACHPEEDRLSMAEFDAVLELMVMAHECQPAQPPELLDLALEAWNGAAPPPAESTEGRVLHTIHELLMSGERPTARRIAQMTGLSARQIYKVGTLPEMTSRYIDRTIRRLCNDHTLVHGMLALIRIGRENPCLFEVGSEREVDGDAPIARLFAAFVGGARAQSVIAVPIRPSLLASCCLGPPLRRFRQRATHPDAWENTIAFGCGLTHALTGIRIDALLDLVETRRGSGAPDYWETLGVTE